MMFNQKLTELMNDECSVELDLIWYDILAVLFFLNDVSNMVFFVLSIEHSTSSITLVNLLESSHENSALAITLIFDVPTTN